MKEKEEKEKDRLYGWTEYLEDHFHKFKEVKNHANSTFKDEYLLLVHIIADKNVGKKLLIRKYSDYHDNDYINTLGITLMKKEVEIDEKKISLMIGVLSPELKEYYSKTYLKGSNGAIFMYDITDAKTLDKIPEWTQLIKNTAIQSNVPILLVGNKLDLEAHREVSKNQVEEILKKNKDIGALMEISLKTGENVEEMFRKIAIMMFKNLK